MERVRTRFAPSPTGRIARGKFADRALRLSDREARRAEISSCGSRIRIRSGLWKGLLEIIYHTLEETGLDPRRGPG